MAVSEQNPINSSTGNGVTTVFPYTFKILSATDLEVAVDGVVKSLTTHYSISGVGDDAGGNVTFVTAPASGTTVTRRRDMALVRTTDYQFQGDLSNAVLNTDQDAPVLMIQQVQEQVDRSVKAPLGEAALQPLPAVAARKNRMLGFDSTLGQPVATTFTMTEVASTIAAAYAGAAGPLDALSFLQSGVGAVSRTAQSKARDHIDARDFGAAADGVTNDAAAVTAATTAHPFVSLGGKVVLSEGAASSVPGQVWHGTLQYRNVDGAYNYFKNKAPLEDTEIQRPRTKSPILDWSGKNVLWLGTSIPAEGLGTANSYPGIFGATMGCTVDNQAWAGSHACYDRNGNAFDLGTVKALSMTEDDRLAGLATHGGTSAYDDSFDPITKASRMTADYRVKSRFMVTTFDCVFLDHNHNDRRRAPGTLTPSQYTITGITKGVTTQITAPGHGRVVGNAVALEVVGIDFLHHAAARVQAVAGDVITLNIDSSAYTGTFTSGKVIALDRSTLYGAFEFLIHYILNCATVYGNSTCKIVLSGAPNEYTVGAGETPHDVYSNAKHLKALATKWGLSFFDIGHEYDIKAHDALTYFPDGVHPTTAASRQALANHWIEWASGGAGKTTIDLRFLPAGSDTVYTEQREALYSKWAGGFGTPDFIVGASTSLASDGFEAGLAGWTTTGTAPTTPTSPWDGANKALYCQSTGAAQVAGIYRTLAYGAGKYLQFDVYFPVVTGLIPSGVGTVTLARMGTGAGPASGQYYSLQAIVRSGEVGLRFATIPVTGGAITYTVIPTVIAAATKYTFRVEAVKGTAAYTGAVLVYMDGVLVGSTYNIDDQTRTNPAYLALGVLASNTNQNLNVYFDNVATGNLAVSDYTARATGTFTTTDGKTATVVNGIITALV